MSSVFHLPGFLYIFLLFVAIFHTIVMPISDILYCTPKAIVIFEIEKLGIELNDRQRNALKSAFMKGFITNQIYRKVNCVSDETSKRGLSQHVERGPKKKGKGRLTKYVPTVGDLNISYGK